MMHMGTSSSARIFLTFLIVFSISCYIAGGLYAYVRTVREKRREKRRTLQERESADLAQVSPVSPERRKSLNMALGKKVLLRKVKSTRARELVSGATAASEARQQALAVKRTAASRRLRRRLDLRRKSKAEPSAQVDRTGTSHAVARANAHWQAIVDPATGKTYYHNPETGETSWVRPVH